MEPRSEGGSPRRPWYRDFFESPDSVPLSCFPTTAETQREVADLVQWLDLTPDDRILDVCCGQGRHAVRLAQRGLHVIGLDASAWMIAQAVVGAQDAGVPPHFLRGEAQRLPVRDGALTHVLNLFNSFGYGDDEESLATLRETARVLRPGGRFLLDTRHQRYQLLGVPYTRMVRLTDGRRARLEAHYDGREQRLNSEWRDRETDALIYRASIRLFEPDELQQMLSSCGLRPVGLYRDYRGSAFHALQRKLIILAMRR